MLNIVKKQGQTVHKTAAERQTDKDTNRHTNEEAYRSLEPELQK